MLENGNNVPSSIHAEGRGRGFACAEFVADRIPLPLHLPLWQRACALEAEVIPLVEDWCFIGDTRAWSIGDLLVFEQRLSASRYERTCAHVERSRGDWLIIRHDLRGSHQLNFEGGHALSTHPGLISVQDWSVPHCDVATAHEQWIIGIPRQRLSASSRMGARLPAVSWPVNSPAGVLLTAALYQLYCSLPALAANGASANSLSSGLVGLVDALLCADTRLQSQDASPRGVARIDAIKHYINANLGEPSLCAQSLCRQFHCSRASLYRLFEPEGGVAAYIQRQRLHACMVELVALNEAPQGLMSQISSAWGFGSSHRFARLFRAQFGMAPLDVLRAREAFAVPVEPVGEMDDYWWHAGRLQAWMSHYLR